jgi:hypothetical protein
LFIVIKGSNNNVWNCHSEFPCFARKTMKVLSGFESKNQRNRKY